VSPRNQWKEAARDVVTISVPTQSMAKIASITETHPISPSSPSLSLRKRNPRKKKEDTLYLALRYLAHSVQALSKIHQHPGYLQSLQVLLMDDSHGKMYTAPESSPNSGLSSLDTKKGEREITFGIERSPHSIDEDTSVDIRDLGEYEHEDEQDSDYASESDSSKKETAQLKAQDDTRSLTRPITCVQVPEAGDKKPQLSLQEFEALCREVVLKVEQIT